MRVIRSLFLPVLFLLIPLLSNAQATGIQPLVDSVLKLQPASPFNGVILIQKDDSILYRNKAGYADLNTQDRLTWDHTFVIGSISKQITAVLVLQEIEKGTLRPEDAISDHLPQLQAAWKDNVTIHHLLTHTHGIISLDEPLDFMPGESFSYSQIGYQLLADIIETVCNDSFANISSELFKRCGMYHTFHPDLYTGARLVKSYMEDTDKNRMEAEKSDFPVAAGGFISTADDLIRWNKHLFEGHLLRDETLKMMVSPKKNAVRNHPIFGTTNYGYGVTTDNSNNVLQIGQTGYLPFYISMDYYFPESKTSVIVLGNVRYGDSLTDAFFYHTQILNIVRMFLQDL